MILRVFFVIIIEEANLRLNSDAEGNFDEYNKRKEYFEKRMGQFPTQRSRRCQEDIFHEGRGLQKEHARVRDMAKRGAL